ncbi:DUF3383 family protein [Domibacillus aminovorans]|uniref:DUF3383 domain-containing protein n=1 Tax=Domibacillus aminovorans TaxID=29332 RepID=A0A177L9I6_9BACI|nr:DUF3383 family protein [Domibacillus aminovorans]OAH61957.1 hypothetical protein AWH49_11075 [Domibacillus aminovorans]
MTMKDVKVTINLRKPLGLTGLGKPLILAQKTGTSSLKNYSSIEAVKVDYIESTSVYKKAFAIFNQEQPPAVIAIATYDTAAVAPAPKTAVDAVTKYYDEDWYFAVVSDEVIAEQIKVADFIELKKFKMFSMRTKLQADRATIKAKSYKYTINTYHVPDEGIDAALVGALGSQEVGSLTWKFKTLKGITPTEMLDDEMNTIHADGAICYVRKMGIAQTSEGKVVSGEYIDVVHGLSWVITEIEKNVQNTYIQNKKLPFDHRGIATLDSATKTALKLGHRQGIIAEDDAKNPIYSTSTLSRTEVQAAERGARIYNGLGFSFELAGAIHEANITGEVIK